MLNVVLHSYSPDCYEFENRCDNGFCMNKTLWCDGIDNCGDFSDELGCGEPLDLHYASLEVWKDVEVQ